MQDELNSKQRMFVGHLFSDKLPSIELMKESVELPDTLHGILNDPITKIKTRICFNRLRFEGKNVLLEQEYPSHIRQATLYAGDTPIDECVKAKSHSELEKHLGKSQGSVDSWSDANRTYSSSRWVLITFVDKNLTLLDIRASESKLRNQLDGNWTVDCVSVLECKLRLEACDSSTTEPLQDVLYLKKLDDLISKRDTLGREEYYAELNRLRLSPSPRILHELVDGFSTNKFNARVHFRTLLVGTEPSLNPWTEKKLKETLNIFVDKINLRDADAAIVFLLLESIGGGSILVPDGRSGSYLVSVSISGNDIQRSHQQIPSATKESDSKDKLRILIDAVIR